MNIEKGQILTPTEEWNKLEKHRKLPDKCEVLDWRKDHCQTGIMVLVKYSGHGQDWLDLGYFKEYQYLRPVFAKWQYA